MRVHVYVRVVCVSTVLRYTFAACTGYTRLQRTMRLEMQGGDILGRQLYDGVIVVV